MDLMLFRIYKNKISEKLPAHLRDKFNTRVNNTLTLLDKETISVESLAILAALTLE